MSLHLPTIHIGGTSRQELSNNLESAYAAVQSALDAMSNIRPHSQDYIPVHGRRARVRGKLDYDAALSEADDRESSLRVILGDLAAMIKHVNQ